jgi:hypothetical protein
MCFAFSRWSWPAEPDYRWDRWTSCQAALTSGVEKLQNLHHQWWNTNDKLPGRLHESNALHMPHPPGAFW